MTMTESVNHFEAPARLALRTQVVEQINAAMTGGQQVIRAYNDGWIKYKNGCETQNLPLMGENGTLGDVDAQGFDLEPEFGHLSREIGIHPDTFRTIRNQGTDLYIDYYRRGQSISGYQTPFGLSETRHLLADFTSRWSGVSLINETNTFFSAEGGSRMIDTTLQVVDFLLKDKGVDQPVFAYSQPSYTPVIAMAKNQGWQLNGELCSESNDYFFAPEQAERIAKQSDLAYMVIINNPTSVTISPKLFQESIKAMQSVNPQMVFLVDLAYLTTIEKSTAHQLMDVFNDPAVFNQSVLITSLSKSHASPGFRFGGSHTGIKNFAAGLNTISSQVNPSCPVSAMIDAFGLLSYVTDEAITQTASIYSQRRNAMIQALNQINIQANEKIFLDVESLRANGGLYVYPQLAKGLDALKLFNRFGLLGINGDCFEDSAQSRRIRFSIGKLRVEQIRSIPERIDYPN